jgi:hypothetical protein
MGCRDGQGRQGSPEQQADRWAGGCASSTGGSATLQQLTVQPSTLPTPGSPLPAAVRANYEQRAGVDLSGVRVHQQPASLIAQRGHDRAFSVGADIVLGGPGNGSDRTLAHEIAHVVQHGGGNRDLADLSGSDQQLHGDGGLSDRDAQAIRDWLAGTPGNPGQGRSITLGPGSFGSPGFGSAGGFGSTGLPPFGGPSLTITLPGQGTGARPRINICNANCHQTPEEQRQEAARLAEEAHRAALRRAWPGLHQAQAPGELDRQGGSIQDDVDASRQAESQLRVRMFDAAIGAGRAGTPGVLDQLDARIRDSWVAAEQAAVTIDAVYRASGSSPVPDMIIDPLRPWFVAFYASVSRLFGRLDTDDRMLSTALQWPRFNQPTPTPQLRPTCPGGCHTPNPGLGLGTPSLTAPLLPAPLLNTSPGPRETRLQQAADAAQQANSQASWQGAIGHFRWATNQLDELLRRRLQQLGGQDDLLQNFDYAKEIGRRQQEFLLANPTALKVQAVFFPKEDVREQHDQTGAAKPVAKAIPWNFYLTRSPVLDSSLVPVGFEWQLHDLTATKGGDRTIRSRYQMGLGRALIEERHGNPNVLRVDPPRSMFENLDQRDFFPEGRLYWRYPISHQQDSIQTNASRPFWEWVSLVGIAISVIGSLVFAPFSTPALLAFALGTGLTLGARYMRLQEMKEHGVWTQADSNRFYWEIAQDLLAATTLGVGRLAVVAAEAGNLARAASAARIWFTLRRVELGVHVVNVGIATVDLVSRYREIQNSKTMAQDQKDAAMRQLATQAVITGALSIVAFNGTRDLLSGRPMLRLTPDPARPGQYMASLSTAGRDVLSETSGLSSSQLRQRPATLEEEFRLSQTMTRRSINDETYDTEILLSNGHAWRRQRGNGRWCRFSDDPLCFIFGEGGGYHIEVFPAQRKARQGFWSGTPGNSEFTPNSAEVLRRTRGAPIVYIDGYPDLLPFAVGVALVRRSTMALRNRDAHFDEADRALARQWGWRLPNGDPDGARVAALRADPTNPLTWHHVEFDNVMLLVPRSIHQAAQHVGGYAQQ